jgi:glucose/arabinose dehydrogenase
MEIREQVCRVVAPLGVAVVGLVGCGGDDEGPNTPPQPVIESPAEGVKFRGGDTLTFTANASDAQDGMLGSGQLVWWVGLHHDDHVHPFAPETPGGSGSINVPRRGETSDNIFLRLHLRATDSAGESTEVTRDVLPQKSQVTLATQPVGLGLTLDGQRVVGPHTFTGVVGIERDLAAATQAFNCRNYQFSNWSQGGSATQTITTPASNTTYTATFTDQGPSSNPPTVALTAPANNSNGNVGAPITLTATAGDSDGTIASVQFFDGTTPIGAADTSAPYSVNWTPASAGSHTLTARATDNCGLATVSAAVTVTIGTSTGDTQPPTVEIAAPAELADEILGSLQITATATDPSGVANVEFQVDGVTIANRTTAPYSASVDTNPYASGQHVLRVRARDNAGNQSAWVTRTVRFGGARALPTGFTRTQLATGLTPATAFTQLPDGRILVALQTGTLRVLQSNGTAIGTMLTVTVDSAGERGLIGVTPHPNFANNGFIYVHYTTPDGGTHNRISRFTVSGNTASGEVQIANLPSVGTATGHNGGALLFGKDGKLYVAVGDNTRGSIVSADLNSPFGKILRFNEDGSIPSDNPFCTTAGDLKCAIWARGLRNPFTLAVRASDGRIHINDVGERTWEEINLGAAGANYGWPSTEGPTGASGITGPSFAFDHDPAPDSTSGFISGCSVIGGAFYPDAGAFPQAYRGSYYFTDFCNTVINRLDMANGNVAYTFGTLTGSHVVGMRVAIDGSLLVLTQTGIVRISAP